MKRAPSRGSFLLLLASFGLTGCQKALSDAECTELLDRYTELLIRSDRPKATVTERDDLKEATRAKAASDPAFSSCSSEVSRSDFECAMKTEDVDSMERCLQ